MRPSNSGIATWVAASSGASPESESSHVRARRSRRPPGAPARRAPRAPTRPTPASPRRALRVAVGGVGRPGAAGGEHRHQQRIDVAVEQQFERRHAAVGVAAQRCSSTPPAALAPASLDRRAERVDERGVAGQAVRAVEADADRRASPARGVRPAPSARVGRRRGRARTRRGRRPRAAARTRAPAAGTCRRGSAAAARRCRRRRGAGTRPTCATAPAGAIDSAVISASGSASPPSASSAIPCSRQRAAQQVDAVRPAAAPAEDAAHDHARAVEHARRASGCALRARRGSRSAPPGTPSSRAAARSAVAAARISVSAVVRKRSTAAPPAVSMRRAHLRGDAAGRAAALDQRASTPPCRGGSATGRRARRVALARGCANEPVARRRSGARGARATRASRARRKPSCSSTPCQEVPITAPATAAIGLAVVVAQQRLAAVAPHAAVADLIARGVGAEPR